MPQVQAWQCKETGQLFLSKEEYRRHLRGLAKERITEFKYKREVARLQDSFRELTRCANFAEIEQWILDHPEVFFANARLHGRFVDDDEKYEGEPQILKVKFRDMRWHQRVKSYHHAPMGQPVEYHNPKSRPAWEGYIEYKLANSRAWNDLFAESPINLGSGGGNCVTLNYRHQVVLFAEDWEAMADIKMLEKLSD